MKNLEFSSSSSDSGGGNLSVQNHFCQNCQYLAHFLQLAAQYINILHKKPVTRQQRIYPGNIQPERTDGKECHFRHSLYRDFGGKISYVIVNVGLCPLILSSKYKTPSLLRMTEFTFFSGTPCML
jgi:hypothetical protein